MLKIIKIVLFLIFLSTPVFAYEDCILVTDGKLTDIKIQHNEIIDVFPLITIMNKKNTLIVHPLKTGNSKFTVIKNNKDKYLFEAIVKENSTIINDVEGFEVLSVDCPPDYYEGYFEDYFEFDEPPFLPNKSQIKEVEK